MMNTKIFEDKTIFITGGTGSWGTELTRQLLEKNPKKIIIFSRGEFPQVTMNRKFNDYRIQFVIGDVRDIEAINQVFKSQQIDYVYHLAALKHVPICENQPQESIKTNVLGTMNLIQVVLRYNVKKFIFVSTDKAIDPISTYGMTKGISERLVIQANCLTKNTEFLCVRSGNVLGTNGSLTHFFIDQIKKNNKITLTDPKMTRYFITQKKVIDLLFFATEEGIGGEIYIINMDSFLISDLVKVLVEHYGNDKTEVDIIGIREGERIHETLISTSEVKRTKYINNKYSVVYPQIDVDRTNFHIWDNPEFSSSTTLHMTTSEHNLKSKDCLKELLDEGGFLC